MRGIHILALSAALATAGSATAQKLPFPGPESNAPMDYTESPIKADISGRVVPPAGVQLGDRLSVRLETHTGIMLQRTLASKSGYFIFSHIVCGFYVVALDVAGYKPVRIDVEHSFIPAEGLMLRLVPGEGDSRAADAEQPAPLRPFRNEAAREFQKGLEAQAGENLASSIEHFKKAISIDPNLDEASLQLALVYLRQRNAAEAQSVLETATLVNPRNPRTLALLGRTYRVQSKWDRAVAALTHALEIKEDYWVAQAEIGQTLVGQGRVDEAFPYVRRAHELNPADPSMHQLFYNTLVRRSNYRAALDELDEFLRLFPKHALAAKAQKQREALSLEIAKTARQ